MSNARIFRYFKTSPEIIRPAVIMYVRYPLLLRNVEELVIRAGPQPAGGMPTGDQPGQLGVAVTAGVAQIAQQRFARA